MKLANLMVPSKTVDMEYPGFEDLTVSVAYLTQDELRAIRKKATTQKFNKKTRQPEDEVDSELFQDIYIKSVIKGWKGFKYSYLEKMIVIDSTQLPNEEYLEGEGLFEYNTEDAIHLMKNCSDFDNWVSTQLEDVANFTQRS